MSMEVCNIKYHCNVLEKYYSKYYRRLYLSRAVVKRLPSFCVVRIKEPSFPPFVFCCYYKGYINITGVRNLCALSVALDVLAKLLKITRKAFGNTNIDNITARCTRLTERKISLQKKRINIRHKHVLGVQYRREIFPNMFIKTTFGTIIWSPKNCVSCVGVKKPEDLNLILLVINELDEA